MSTLKKSKLAWGSSEFDLVFKIELSEPGIDQLPLQQGLSFSSIALDKDLSVVILQKSEEDNVINIKSGIFYSGIISGCSCADDPSSMQEQSEYCEVYVCINKVSGEAAIRLLLN